MSEPKTIARTIDEVVPGLFHYQVHDERIDHISDGYAVVDKGRVILVDPLPIDGAALTRLGAIGDIVVASASHQRSAWSYRRETKASVHAPQGAQGLDESPDATFRGGDRLPGGLRAMHAPGPKGPDAPIPTGSASRRRSPPAPPWRRRLAREGSPRCS